MHTIRFEWDENKNLANQHKHGISFEEARTVFYDNFARIVYDPDHSKDEDRFILLGLSQNLRLLIVVHVYHKDDDIIRIISSRNATKNEAKHYKRNY